MHAVAKVIFVVSASLGVSWALSLEKERRRANDLDAQVLARTRGRVNLSNDAATVVDMGTALLEVKMAFPVAIGKSHRVAFIARYKEEVWEAIRGESYDCVFEDGQTEEAQLHGHESSIAYPKVIVAICKLPSAVVVGECQSVKLRASSMQQNGDHTVQVCHNDHVDLAYDVGHVLTACVPIPYEDPLHLNKSGFIQLPQWLEYNAMHGVDHFVFYLLSNFPEHRARTLKIAQPFLEQGAASFVEVDGFSDPSEWTDYHSYMANDCLYRMKQRTHWLMTTIDSDEYVHFEGGVSDFAAGLNALEESFPNNRLTSVAFKRYQYMLPDNFTQLQIASAKRQDVFAALCPKYILRPDNVYSVFIHWPVSVAEGAVQLASEKLWAAHFRLTNETVKEKMLTMVSDDVLVPEVDNLRNRLVAHYGSSGIEGLAIGLLSRQIPQPRAGISMDEYEEHVAQEVPDWVQKFNHESAVSEHLIFEPPVESEVRVSE